jgi:exodeoxyribonuclease VII large subunit
MSEIINNKTVFSLIEVTTSIQKTIAARYTSTFWIKAEMIKLNLYTHSGHCYPELVEKRNGKVIAQLRSIIWKDDYNSINNNFLKILKEPLKDGIKILFCAKISFEPVHGLSLTIIDIDPAFTLGDLEKEKQETINRMKEEGIFNLNRLLQIPMLPQRIAIISVETSKGYADFLKVIEGNPWNYKFFHLLFPSILQGENAITSISRNLKRIKKVSSHFDVVAIIRGGGGDVGLSCYNNYELAKEIAKFPIPVITGIGHSTNETVVELISFSNAITPTKIAEYLLQKFHNFSVPVQAARDKIIDKSRRLLSEEKTKFGSEIKLFRSATKNILIEHRNQVKGEAGSLMRQCLFRFKNENDLLQDLRKRIKGSVYLSCRSSRQEIKQLALNIRSMAVSLFRQIQLVLDQHTHQITRSAGVNLATKHTEIKNIETNINNLSPANVLKRGYSITLHNGKAIKSYRDVKAGDVLNTVLFEGNIQSVIESSQKPKEQ